MTTDAIRLTSAEADFRSGAYGLIAHGFRYPDQEWIALLTGSARSPARPSGVPTFEADTEETWIALKAAIEDLRNAGALESTQANYAMLFGHTVRGTCPPYELEYGKSEVIQRAADLADISGFYAAFGMECAGEISERPDHVSVEAEFMAILCAKEAWGIRQSESDLTEAVVGAQGEFLRAHLGRWLPAFTRRVLNAQAGEFYARLADFAAAFVAGECRRHDAALGSPYLELRLVDPTEESSQTCGIPGECSPRGREPLTQLNVSTG